MGRWSGKSCRLATMIALTGSFFLVEVTVGYIVNSVALVADSFHMLSDVVSLIVGLAAVKVSTMNSKSNTFGWARAEVLGALVNAVFLIALCFTIIIDAVQRINMPESIEDPDLMLIVGGVGLLVNLMGLCMFHGHAHSHGGGGHGHSHGGSKSTAPPEDTVPLAFPPVQTYPMDEKDLAAEPNGLANGDLVESGQGAKSRTRKASAHQLNMRGVFLHVLGDALGSVVVIVSGLIIKYVPGNPTWTSYVDPCLSLVIVIIILGTSFPLLKESAMILLQTVPPHIVVSQLQTKLSEIEGILDVHELHIWRLAGDKVIASVHIKIKSLREYNTTLAKIKAFFHENGIHSVTIQPELLDLYSDKLDRDCSLECGPDKSCYSDTCCARKSRNGRKLSAQNPDSATVADPEGQQCEMTAAVRNQNVIIAEETTPGESAEVSGPNGEVPMEGGGVPKHNQPAGAPANHIGSNDTKVSADFPPVDVQ